MPDADQPAVFEPVTCTPVERAPGWPGWDVGYRTPSGAVIEHGFAVAHLAARAAEYGLDPADPLAAIELMLYEPWMPEHEPDRIHSMLPADALVEHQSRLAQAKIQVRIDLQHDVLAPLHDGHEITPDVVAEHRAAIDARREQLLEHAAAPRMSVLGLPAVTQ